MLNDTGSNVSIIFDHEAVALGYNPILHPTRQAGVMTASGPVIRNMVDIEMRIVDYQNNPLTDWFSESAVMVPYTGQARLSGEVFRRYVYVATAPRDSGNFLHVARTKTGLKGILPGTR
jgi:hypothetical protein